MVRGRGSEARAEDEPALGGRTCRHLAVDLDAFANADETVPEAVALRSALAVVPYLDLQLVRPIANGRASLACACLSAFVRPSWTMR